jgi:protein-S-isoprenylcysteine O-methyltransferase Ste14
LVKADTSPIVLTVAYLILAFVLLFVSIEINSSLTLPVVESPVLLVIGLISVAIGFAFRYLSLNQLLGANKSIQWRYVPEQLVENGVYRYSRNPTYLGILLMLLGAFLIVANLPMLIILVAFFIILNRQVSYEEKVITEKFGETYLSYKKKTRRWL